MKIQSIRNHLEFNYKQCRSYPRASKACASKVHVGHGFTAQVVADGIALRCPRTAECPGMTCRGEVPATVRSVLSDRPFLQGDVHSVVLTCAGCTGLSRRRCVAVCYCSPCPPVSMSCSSVRLIAGSQRSRCRNGNFFSGSCAE